jgi:hypothetical protein
MTARDEDILTSRALLKQGKAISVLLKSCLSNKSIDVDNMLVGDRNAVLIAIRITGYGPEYEIAVECPACDEKSKTTFDLSKLPVKPLGTDPVQVGQNLFSFVLPVSRKEVTFRLATGADEADISSILERTKKAVGPGAVENVVTTRLQHQMVSLGGETDPGKLAQIVRNLPARDSRDMRGFVDSISPGVEMVQKYKCPACGEESEVDVPLGTEFFWPAARR